MSEKAILKNMRCPTCGASLKAENNTEAIICVYCGNSIVPVAEAHPVSQNENTGALSGVLRVEGVTTPASVLAYLDQFCEEYDWEAFSYAQTLSIAELDRLASSLKSSAYDDKNTWLVCFKSIYVPFIRKIDGCKQILSSVIDEYKNENLDAYSKFDAYKRIAAMIRADKCNIIANLEKIVLNATKYELSAPEAGELNAEIESIRNIADVVIYNDIKAIPEVKAFIEERNAAIAKELAAKGINVENEYAKAKALADEGKYVDALNILHSLKGYSDTNLLIEKIDKYFLISDVLEVGGNLYFFKESNNISNLWDLYPSKDNKISDDAIIKNILKIITNYADIIYYLGADKKLKRYNMSAKAEEVIFDNYVDPENIFIYNRRVFFIAGENAGDYSHKNIIELNSATGEIKVLFNNAAAIDSMTDNKMICKILKSADSKDNPTKPKPEVAAEPKPVPNVKETLKKLNGIKDINTLLEIGKELLSCAISALKNEFSDNGDATTSTSSTNNGDTTAAPASGEKATTCIVNVDTMDVIELGAKNVFFKGFIGNYAVYTQNSPNAFNENLYIKSFDSNEPEILIEQNIYDFCSIVGNKLLYYVGNSINKSLININCDGTERKEWPQYISKVLFEQGGWIYFIRRAGYNSVLCKSRTDGSKFSIIAADIEEFIEIKNGYLYYINDVSSLVKVRMDGSNLQILCNNVKQVLAIKEDKIIFVAADDALRANEFASAKPVNSIYAANFSGSGNIKLAYNIKDAQKYDEDTVYYIGAEEIKESYDKLHIGDDMLYKLDVETNTAEKMFELQQKEPEQSDISAFAIAMIIAAVTLMISILGFACGAFWLGAIGLFVCTLSLVIGFSIKMNEEK